MITIRFYKELNDFLEKDKKQKNLSFEFQGKRSVKDFIESFGVPHTEVDLILINGESAGFETPVRDGDRVSVYPVFEYLNIRKVTRLRPEPLRNTRFILDVHLGKLARNLRLLGFDSDYRNRRSDPELASVSIEQHRILLTRDRGLLMRKNIQWGLIIRGTEAAAQTAEVLDRLDLWEEIRPFSRCLSCNGILGPLPREDIESEKQNGTIPSGVALWCREFYRCPDCGKVYWAGSHHSALTARINSLKERKRSV